MTGYSNEAIGIPQFVRGLCRAAENDDNTGWHTWGHQEKKDEALAVVYVEHHEPRLAACVRSCGACALLSRAIYNNAACARCSFKVALREADGSHGISAGVQAKGSETTHAGLQIDNADAGCCAEVVAVAAGSKTRRAPGIAGAGPARRTGAGGGASVPNRGGRGAAAGAGANGARAATSGARPAEEIFDLIR